jgi:hypothetical protein
LNSTQTDQLKQHGAHGVIIFDGSCGACSFLIGEKKKFFERYGFGVVPFQEPWIRELTGLSEEILQQSIHLYTTSGEVYKGVDLFACVAGKIWWMVPLSWILRIPFCKPFYDKVYNYIAKRRKKFSKACGLDSRAIYK